MKITSDLITSFRNEFRGTFSDASEWPDSIIIEALCEADSETGGSGWGTYVDECGNFKRRGMFYYAAHYLAFIYGDDPSAPISGIARLNTQSKQVGDESISYRVAAMMDAGNDALTYTVFGQQFYRMRRRAAMGARAV